MLLFRKANKWRTIWSVASQSIVQPLFHGKQSLSIDELEKAVLAIESGRAQAVDDDYAFLLRQCASLQSLKYGNRVVELMGCSRGRYLTNLAMEMYGKCKSPNSAAAVFKYIENPNVYSWTMLMLAYGQNGYEKEALVVFSLMDLDGVAPSKVAFSAVLAICSRLGSYELAREMHFCLQNSDFESDVFLQTSTLSMYAKCWKLEDAKRVFDGMGVKSEVTWNAMISAYTQHGLALKALELFRRMDQEGVKQSDVSFVCLLEAWTILGNVSEVIKMEQRVREIGYGSYKTLQTSILCFYGKHGRIEDARRVFDALPCKNSVAWNSIIGIYSQHGYALDAIDLYEKMKAEEVKPDEITFVVALDACSSLGKLDLGRMVHQDMVSHGFGDEPLLTNVLLNMYGRCGSLEDAKRVFARAKYNTSAAWNSMMTQLEHHGAASCALEMFMDMQVEGVEFDDITFITLLSLCSHMGLFREGIDLFFALNRDYGISYTLEHYGCMVDLLGRTGMLQEAEELMDTMPFRASSVVCTSYLNACRLHGDVERGRTAAERAIVADPESDGTIIILEQIYVNAGRGKEFPTVRVALEELRNKALEKLT